MSQLTACSPFKNKAEEGLLQSMWTDLGPAALLAQQVGVAIRLLPLLLVRVSPHQLPVAQVVDLLPLLLAADTLLVPSPGLKHTAHFTQQHDTNTEPRPRHRDRDESVVIIWGQRSRWKCFNAGITV